MSTTATDNISTIMQLSATRLNEMGNNGINGSQQNSERISAMFGIRAGQANPVEAASIGALANSSGPGNAQSNALAGALASILANLASVTPTTTPVTKT